MARKSDAFMACMSSDDLDFLVRQTRIKSKGREIAYDVLVCGVDISTVAQKHSVSEQWVLSLCKRIKQLKNNSQSVKISVIVPASIAPQARQLLTGLKEIYELGMTEKGAIK